MLVKVALSAIPMTSEGKLHLEFASCVYHSLSLFFCNIFQLHHLQRDDLTFISVSCFRASLLSWMLLFDCSILLAGVRLTSLARSGMSRAPLTFCSETIIL